MPPLPLHPPPVPVPPPVPTPATPQPFVVGISPSQLDDLLSHVDKFAPHGNGLTSWGPVATALVALLAAVIAYRGVLRQVRGTAKQAEIERQDKAEKGRRAARFRLLHSASDQTLALERDAIAFRFARADNTVELKKNLDQKYFDMMLLKDEFVINELPKSAEALQKFIWQINAAEAGHASAEVAEELRTALLLACKDEIGREHNRVFDSASSQR